MDAGVPIVAITAHALPEKRQEVIEAGMNDLLSKPYLPLTSAVPAPMTNTSS